MNNQNDRELLELAAKAAGIEGNYEPKYFCGAGLVRTTTGST